MLLGVAVAQTTALRVAVADDDRPPTRSEVAARDLELRAGARLLEAGRLQEARAPFLRALAVGFDIGAAASFNLCLTDYALGDYGRAINECYQALELEPERVLELLDRIGDRLAAAGIYTHDLLLPEPEPGWRQLAGSVKSYAPVALPVVEGATRLRPPPVIAPLEGPVPEARLPRLGAQPPANPYRELPSARDYTVGYDAQLLLGALFYAPDTEPAVAGMRISRRTRAHGAEGYVYWFGEYLHAVEGGGGVAAIGPGLARENGIGLHTGLSVPWGRDARRQNAAFPGYTLALHFDLGASYRYEITVGRVWRVTLQADAGFGLNLGKGLSRIKDNWDNLGCDDCESPDRSPHWPTAHGVIALGIGIGKRAGYARYARYDVFAPIGAP